MASVASGGAAARIVARILFNVVRAGSATPARYASTALAVTELAFFIRAILPESLVAQDGDGVDADGAAGRDPTGGGCDGAEQERDGAIGSGVGSGHAV